MIQQQITNKRHLLKLLYLTEQHYQLIIDSPDKYYKPFTKTTVREDGSIKERHICPSIGRLREVQVLIKDKILSQYVLPRYITGGVKGNSNVTNANMHKGKHAHFCLDLKSFFPSVDNGLVNKVFLRLGFSRDTASILTQLVTYNRAIPQGAPTSTIVTNLVFHYLADAKIQEIVAGRKIDIYTRFVDDLNFSSQQDFRDLVPAIIKVVAGTSLKINKEKTFYKFGKVDITGANVGQNRLNPTQKLLKKLESTTSERSKAGIEAYIQRLELQ